MAFITMNFDGLEELKKQLNRLANEQEILKVEKRIITKNRDVTAERMKPKIPRSADHTKSGGHGGGRFRGYYEDEDQTDEHAADNIPVSGIRTSGGSPTAEVGWEKTDTSIYFYMKFIEWGTYKMPPRDFIYNTITECRQTHNANAESEMQNFLNSTLGSD